MGRRTGYETGYGLPPIGSAEILESLDHASEFGLPADYADPAQYRGTTPDCERIIAVDNDLRI